MRKQIIKTALLFGLLVSMTACKNYDIIDEELDSTQTVEENPFSQTEENGALGSVCHVETNPNRDADQSILPYEYDGGEFTLEYQFSTEGKLDNIGFLLFLDGKQQAYKINDTNAELEYFHCFATSDQHEENFSFLFTPNTGKCGDTLNITIISLTNPDFLPDMKETSSYGWYHKPLERVLSLHFNEDAPEEMDMVLQSNSIFSSVKVSEQKVTADYLETELAKNGWNQVTMDTLNDSVYTTISYDGERVYDHLNVSGKDSVTVRYTICGTAGMEYGISFFLDHEPLSFEDRLSYPITLSKGNVSVVEAVIDTSKLDGFHTFYVVAVAANDKDTIPALKTESMLLYKETEQTSAETGSVEDADFSGKVTGCYYADGENIIVAADRLYLYDTQAGEVLADVDICLQDLKVQTFSDGYFVVGEGGATASGSFMAVNSSGITVYLLDQDFHIKDTISMSGLVDSDFVISTSGISISEDGNRIAFCGTQGLYLYDVSGKNVSTILKYSENAIANNTQIVMIDSIVFTDSNTLAYTGNGIDIGSTGNGFSIYGMVSVDNAALSITKKASYEVAELQIGGSMLVMPQSFNKNNGTLLLFDTIASTEQTINFETGSEGKDGVFCSQNGNYVATASLGDTSVTIKIYDLASGNVIHTEKISDSNSTYFLRIPQILLLDDSKTCIAILGRGISEVDTLISSFGFECISCKAACIHEEVAEADSECPLYG